PSVITSGKQHSGSLIWAVQVHWAISFFCLSLQQQHCNFSREGGGYSSNETNTRRTLLSPFDHRGADDRAIPMDGRYFTASAGIARTFSTTAHSIFSAIFELRGSVSEHADWHVLF